MNVNVPVWECLVRSEFLYNFEKPDDAPDFTPAIVVGAASIPGRALGFHVILDNGAQFGRLPVWALVHQEAPKPYLFREADFQLWDCPSEKCEVIVYDAIEGCKARVRFSDGSFGEGFYRMTFDWWGSATSEGAGDLGWKCAHLIELDTGTYTLQPNNRCQFQLREWTGPEFPAIPHYKTMQQTFSVEGG